MGLWNQVQFRLMQNTLKCKSGYDFHTLQRRCSVLVLRQKWVKDAATPSSAEVPCRSALVHLVRPKMLTLRRLPRMMLCLQCPYQPVQKRLSVSTPRQARMNLSRRASRWGLTRRFFRPVQLRLQVHRVKMHLCQRTIALHHPKARPTMEERYPYKISTSGYRGHFWCTGRTGTAGCAVLVLLPA